MDSNLTPEMLADLLVPHDLCISPNGEHVVYSLQSTANRKDRWTSEIWIADIGKKESARQLTEGGFDMWPQWSSDSEWVAFVSDRKEEGVNAVIYSQPVDGGDLIALTPVHNRSSIAKFAISPDGKYIAYLSADEKTPERNAKDEQKDDPIVYGESWQFQRLRCLELGSKAVTTLVSVPCQISDFHWSRDSTQIAYATSKTPEIHSSFQHGQDLAVVNISHQKSTNLQHFSGQLQDLTWHENDLYWRSTYTPGNMFSSWCLYGMSVSRPQIQWTRRAYGKDRDASPFVHPPGIRSTAAGLIVQVQNKLDDQLQIHDTEEIIYDDFCQVRSWDILVSEGKRILALITSSASIPNEVYSVVDGVTTCLSSHGSYIAKLGIADAEAIHAIAQDGTPIDGVLWISRNADRSAGPMPTVVTPHGGPCFRITASFNPTFPQWTPWLVSQGYAVLSPNYGGSTGHGEKFAARVRGCVGRYDYSDMIDLLREAIKQGIVDEKRCGIGGWSQGGYLSYLAITRDSTFHFAAAVCGAGGTDWDLGIQTSDTPIFATQLAGRAPWELDDGGKNIENRKGSPIHHMSNIKTPILILHGENDDRVHITHARSFHWGCLHRGLECEFVVYPREGHGAFPPFERMHYIDTLKRMARFFGKHLEGEEDLKGQRGEKLLSKAEQMLNR